jgi:hypothetical protein
MPTLSRIFSGLLGLSVWVIGAIAVILVLAYFTFPVLVAVGWHFGWVSFEVAVIVLLVFASYVGGSHV